LTNCTTVKTSFLKLLENFLDVEISCSIDGVGKWIEYQRTGSNWESIKRNFSKLQQSNISTVSLTPVITQLNVLGVADFLEWAITQNACYIAFNEIQHPEWFRWQLVPLEYRKKVLKKLNKLNLEQHNIDPNWLQFRKNLKTEVQTLDEETRHRWSGDLILWEYGSNEKYFDHYPWGKALYEGTL
jgi:MoaA/NifB/PqqE/SkfB family radical SAM enzyme